MSNKITGKEYPLSKVFDADFEYHIPGYQRPYAWTEEEMCDIMTPTNRNLRRLWMKKRYYVLITIFLLIAFCVVWNIYDNQRFVVTEQTVTLDDLPNSFDGYRILQISDLHGKYFGENQLDLLSAINQLDYDCILFTGDMNKYEESDLLSSQAIFDLINGIEKKEMAFWVDGNTGPFAIDMINGSCTGNLTKIGKEIEESGVNVLLSPVEITREGESIWLVPELNQTDIQMNYLEMTEDMFESTEDYQNVILYGQELQKWYEQLSDNGQVKIRVNHYPIQANMTQADWDGLGYLDYDLSIAGHYHGGQLRLPFFGALYIPSPTSGIANGYFPKQNEVKGLNQIIDMQQYISAGLGSSASISFLDFRLFNTPEINLITLRCHK